MKELKEEKQEKVVQAPEESGEIARYIRQQARYQKIYTGMLGVLLVMILAGFLYIVQFAHRTKIFMADMKATMEQAGAAIEQADATMKQAAVFLEAAGDKLDTLDVDSINSAVGKTDELLNNMDGIVEKTDNVLSALDSAVEKTEAVADGIQKFSGIVDNLKKKLESVTSWIPKK